MNGSITRRLPEKYVEAISPEQCWRYLQTHGWYQDGVIEDGEVILIRHPDNADFVLQLPLTRKYADYALQVSFAITTSAAQEQRPYWEVYMDMAGRFYVGPHTYSTISHCATSPNGKPQLPEVAPAA